MKKLAILSLLALSGAALASPVSFNVTAQVTYISDSWSHFPGVLLGDTISMAVNFDTSNATLLSTPGNYPDAWYGINGEPAYLSANLDAQNYASQAAGPNYLYVTTTHPTVDFVDYYGTVGSGTDVEMYFQGPKGTLPNGQIPAGFPPEAWTYEMMRIVWNDPATGHSGMVMAENNLTGTPEPASIAALGIGAAALIRRRKARA